MVTMGSHRQLLLPTVVWAVLMVFLYASSEQIDNLNRKQSKLELQRQKEILNYVNSIAAPSKSFAKHDELLSVARASMSSRLVRGETPDNLERDKASKRHQYIHVERAKSGALQEYVQRGRAPKDAKHKIVVAVKQRNMEQLERILHEVSDPEHPQYGHYLTVEEVRTLTRNEAGVNRVVNYVNEHNRVNDNGKLAVIHRTYCDEFITIEGRIEDLEILLDTEFYEFEHREFNDKHVFRALEYSIPNEWQNHVIAVLNTIHFPTRADLRKDVFLSKNHNMFPKNQESSSMSSTANDKISTDSVELQRLLIPDYVTPLLLSNLYRITNNTGNHLASQGVYETLDQNYSPSDLTLFQNHFALPQESVAHVIGGHNKDKTCTENYGQDCAEANLDIQYLMAVAQNVPSTYYYWADDDFMVAWLTKVADMQNPPLVLSVSYGADESVLPASYPSSFDTIAMKLGVRGITITVSSGDDGAVSSGARRNPLRCGYAPSFPASSPYVVAVGGTMGPENGGAEVACQSDLNGVITTGGGISRVYPLPTWQRDFVEGYLQRVSGTSHDPSPGFSRSGRGLPDISVLARNYVIALGGNFTAVSGTSASSPVFAGMISLVNSARLAAGKPALGWVTPALYKLSSSFVRDVKSGHNKCVASATVCCQQGFYATDGWDPVTGLGSLDFTLFKDAMMKIGDAPDPNQPTFQPTLAPVDIPSEPPTSSPTKSTGWMYLRQYDQESCTGKITVISGVPTNRCMIEYDKEQQVIGSRIYTCGKYATTVSYFTSTDCTTDLIAEEEYFYGCAYKVEDYYYAPQYYSVDVQCSDEASNIPPLPKYDGSYALNSNYDSTTGCIYGTESSVDATLSNYCFNVQAQEFSYKLVYPKINLYEALSCHARDLAQSVALNTQCQVVEDDDYYSRRRLVENENIQVNTEEEYYYGIDVGSVALHSVWTKASTAPTKPPTMSPTIALNSHSPTLSPATDSPTVTPTVVPTTESPTIAPSAVPTVPPTVLPTTASPTLSPTTPPSLSPGETDAPTDPRPPTEMPSEAPSIIPTIVPSPLPSATPTVLPSLLPTVIPTNTNAPTEKPSLSTDIAESSNNMQILLSQVLTGITQSEWLSDSSSCFTVFANAVIEVFPSLSVKDLSLLSVQPYESYSMSRRRLAATSAGVNVTYTISVNVKKEGYSSTGLAYYSMRDSLQLAVTNGDFDLYLNHYANTANVPVMKEVKSPTIQFISVRASTSSDGAAIDTQDQGQSIAIAVILVLFVAVLSCLCLHKGAQSVVKRFVLGRPYSEVAMDSDSTHHSSHPLNQDVSSRGVSTRQEDEDEVEIELANTHRSSTSGVSKDGYSTVSNPMAVRGRGESV